jgi:hypothetical protein
MFRDLVTAVLGLVWVAILVLVGARFVFLLMGTDSTSRLAEALYHRSDFWLRPVFEHLGLANKALLATGGGSFELASLVAFGVYLLAGWLLLAIVRDGIFAASDPTYAY